MLKMNKIKIIKIIILYLKKFLGNEGFIIKKVEIKYIITWILGKIKIYIYYKFYV
jgi:hypothetical protein